jgi:outer membrane immunogenic protein
MRRIAFLCIAAVFCADISAAYCADLSPSYAPRYNWNGFYAGLHLGGAWGQNKAVDTANWNGTGSEFTANPNGFVGGAQIGYNWQADEALVLGLEADIGYLGFNGSATSPLAVAQGTGTTISSEGGLYGSIRPRIGFAWDRAMIYGTGGLIFANVRSQVVDNLAAVPIATNRTTTQTGWTVGGGVEVALSGSMSGWSVRGEYLYFDLGSETATGVNALGTFTWDVRTTGSIGRFGLNRRF